MKLNHVVMGFLLVWSSLVVAADPELRLIDEHPVDGMRGGNLSGLTRCGSTLWTVSDRDDDQIYTLDTGAKVWKAQPVAIRVPPIPAAIANDRPVNAALDFEAISCDDFNEPYILSETYSAVLKITRKGDVFWLPILRNVVQAARAAGMLQQASAQFEGLAVAPSATWLVLAGERERRGLVKVEATVDGWTCPVVNCVIRSEGGVELQPPQFPGAQLVSRDFSDVIIHSNKIFTLNRNAFKICRFALVPAEQPERCWSFAAAALTPPRLYPDIHGMAEALYMEDDRALVGIDNNNIRRADGELRPVIFHFAAPAGGWLAAP